MFDWNDLRYFLAVARHGSTLAAARALRLSQSTVHRRLAALEQQLGRRLVTRHPTGYRLTRLGDQMRPYAENVEASVATLERQFVASDPGQRGLVRISCPASAAHRLMAARLLDKFHARHPALRAEFVMTEEFYDLAQGEVELAIWQGAPQNAMLIARRIADVPWAVFASRSYIAAHGRPEAPEAMARHAVVEFAGPMKNHAAALWLRSVAPRARVAARGNSVSEIFDAIKSSVGLGLLPAPYAKRESDLVMVLESRAELNFPFYVVIHRDMRRVRRVRGFLDFLAGEQKLVRRTLEVGLDRERG